jgi:hypothetical protein
VLSFRCCASVMSASGTGAVMGRKSSAYRLGAAALLVLIGVVLTFDKRQQIKLLANV